LLAAGAHVVMEVGTGEPATVGLLLYTDALSAWLDLVLAVVGTTGTLFAVGYLDEQFDRGLISLRRFRQFFYLFDLFLAAMLIAVNVGDVALMWIAIEGSTLVAALLIAFERNKAALEAGWKFMILGSVGIALALFGTIILYYTSEHVLGVTSDALRWSELYRIAGSLDPTAIKVAFVFVLIGYGTKAGVAPMHSWLPDAHTDAPTAGSVILAAVLLKMGTYGFIRFSLPILPEASRGCLCHSAVQGGCGPDGRGGVHREPHDRAGAALSGHRGRAPVGAAGLQASVRLFEH